MHNPLIPLITINLRPSEVIHVKTRKYTHSAPFPPLAEVVAAPGPVVPAAEDATQDGGDIPPLRLPRPRPSRLLRLGGTQGTHTHMTSVKLSDFLDPLPLSSLGNWFTL